MEESGSFSQESGSFSCESGSFEYHNFERFRTIPINSLRMGWLLNGSNNFEHLISKSIISPGFLFRRCMKDFEKKPWAVKFHAGLFWQQRLGYLARQEKSWKADGGGSWAVMIPARTIVDYRYNFSPHAQVKLGNGLSMHALNEAKAIHDFRFKRAAIKSHVRWDNPLPSNWHLKALWPQDVFCNIFKIGILPLITPTITLVPKWFKLLCSDSPVHPFRKLDFIHHVGQNLWHFHCKLTSVAP